MNLSRENRLLLYCTNATITEDKLKEVKDIVRTPLNWEKILSSALSQGIAPLLYHNMKRIQENPFIPEKVMDNLRKAYHQNLARNMYLYEELNRILKAFHKKGIEVMVLKGAALAKAVYDDFGLRPMCDIDLLIKKNEISCARQIMSDLDYLTRLDKISEEWHEKKHFHLPVYIHRDKPIVVEIHQHITGKSFHINIDEWWERARLVEFDDCQPLIPSPEDILIHLSLHLYNHGYDKITLRSLCDISETLRRYGEEINWQRFQESVEDYSINKPVYTLLYLVKEFYKDNNNSLNWLKQELIDSRLFTLIKKRIFSEEEIYSNIPTQVVQTVALNTFWKKSELLIKRFFPTREEMHNRYSLPYPSKRVYFYYAIRPFNLIMRYKRFIRFLRPKDM